MLEVVISKEKEKILKQINAIKYVLEHDTREIDKQIHLKALERLEAAYNSI